MSSLLLTIILGLTAGSCRGQTGPVVDTAYGALRGVSDVDKYTDLPYDAFFGIPYVSPPVGSLRWQKPQPPEPWDGVRNATEYGAHCIQFIGGVYRFLGFSDVMSEDCLYMNIWIPQNVDYALANQLPVMVFFYGGAYVLGTAEMYPGLGLALQGDVIVVNFNFRISIMGFLSTGDEAAPGNYGLWDCKAALEWVQQNIAAFGGDPNRVTVFGQSAGAAMTSHVMISPQTQHLLHRAIPISGGSTGYLSYTTDAPRTVYQVAARFDCNRTDSQEMVDCLRGVNAEELDRGYVSMVAVQHRVPNLMPVLDGDFIPQDPRLTFQQGSGKDTDFITGNTESDGALFVTGPALGMPPLIGGDDNTTDYGRAETLEDLYNLYMFLLGATSNAEDLLQEVIQQYPSITSDDVKTRAMVSTDSITDWLFTCTRHWEALVHAQSGGTGSTYMYKFSYRPSFLTGYPPFVNGSHVDDLYMVLGQPFMEFFRRFYLDIHDFNEEDLEITYKIQDYLGNFARNGDPNVGVAVDLAWPEYSATNQVYLLETPSMAVEPEPADDIDNSDFFMDFFKQFEYPPPIEPQGTAAVTEDDIERGMESLKSLLSAYLGYHSTDMWTEVESQLRAALPEAGH